MNKGTLFALILIALAVVIIINNTGSMSLHLVGDFIVQTKESIILLGFFIAGTVTGIFLKS
jgi:uncharacterized integral membrane protein